MAWKTVKFEKEKPTKTKVKLKTVKINGKIFGAGPVIVGIGGAQVPAIAMRAGSKKYILEAHHAPDWLISQGFPEWGAEAFVRHATIEAESTLATIEAESLETVK